jgi:hypothetical protein
MTFDRQSGGHAFDFDRGVCVRCGMTREQYEDSGEPRCKGKQSGHRQVENRGSVALVDPDDA